MRKCARCRKAFEPRAEGQIACGFTCARLMVPREPSRTVATTVAEPRIAEALAETRANVAGMKGAPS